MSLHLYQEKNVLTKEECETIIQKALPFLQKSQVTGEYDFDHFNQKKFRMSEEAHFHIIDDDVVTRKLRNKIKDISGLPISHQESICVINYTKDGYFLPHYDYFGHDTTDDNRSNQRLFTYLIYLNEDFEGGITEFPKENIKIKPETGLLITWNNVIDGTNELNPKSLHCSTEITSGEKWVVSVWVREHQADFTKNLLINN